MENINSKFLSQAVHFVGQWFIPALLGYFVLSRLSRRYFHPLSKIPGPNLASISRTWLAKTMAQGKFHADIVQAHKKYGPMIRAAPNKVFINDPDLITVIYGAGSKFYKSNLYEIWDPAPGTSSSFSERSIEKHAQMRRRVGPAYSNSAMLQMEPYIDNIISSWIQKLASEYVDTPGGPRAFDFVPWSHYLTSDVLSELGFGQSFGFIATGSDVRNYIDAMHSILPSTVVVGNFHWLMKLLTHPVAQRVMSMGAGDEVGLGNLMRLAKELVEERWEKGKVVTRQDMLQKLYDQELSAEEAINESTQILGAGGDTTAMTLRAIVLFVCSNPVAYNKLQAELAPHFNPKTGASSVISNSTARSLRYLSACIKEALRLWPPAIGVMERVVPQGGLNVHGYSIPEGSVVCMHQWAICRNTDLFGPDAEFFVPERWLVERPQEEKRRMDRAAEFAWGAGARVCLGQNLALFELHKAVAELFGRFDVGLANVSKPWTSIEYGFFIQSDMMVRLTRKTALG